MSVRNEIANLRYLVKDGFNLVSHPEKAIAPELTDVSRRNAEIIYPIHINEESTLLPGMLDVLKRNPNISFDNSPYWQSGLQYNALEIVRTTVQFFDGNQSPLPITTIPPEKDVKNYFKWIYCQKHRVTISEQFEKLLEITRSLIGAANLGMLAHRHFARGSDHRVFPNIKINPNEIKFINDRLAQFEVYDNSKKSDGPGDTYYFWTQVFTALAFSHSPNYLNHLYKSVFEHGNSLMQIATHLVGTRTITSHDTAAMLGWNIGLALSNYSKAIIEPNKLQFV